MLLSVRGCQWSRDTEHELLDVLPSCNTLCNGLCNHLCNRPCNRPCNRLCNRLCNGLCNGLCNRLCNRLCNGLPPISHARSQLVTRPLHGRYMAVTLVVTWLLHGCYTADTWLGEIRTTSPPAMKSVLIQTCAGVSSPSSSAAKKSVGAEKKRPMWTTIRSPESRIGLSAVTYL